MTEICCDNCWGWFDAADVHITDHKAVCAWCINKRKDADSDAH